MKLSDKLRKDALTASKHGHSHDTALRAADELDRRAATIRRLQARQPDKHLGRINTRS